MQLFFTVTILCINQALSVPFETSLQPSNDIHSCPEREIKLVCNETGVNRLTWKWENSSQNNWMNSYLNDMTLELNVSTRVILKDGILMTTAAERSLSPPLYLTSVLLFIPTINFTSANVSCNNERRYIEAADFTKPQRCCNASILTSFNNSLIHFNWSVQIATVTIHITEGNTITSSLSMDSYFVHTINLEQNSSILLSLPCNTCTIAKVDVIVEKCASINVRLNVMTKIHNQYSTQNYLCTKATRLCGDIDSNLNDATCSEESTEYTDNITSEKMTMNSASKGSDFTFTTQDFSDSTKQAVSNPFVILAAGISSGIVVISFFIIILIILIKKHKSNTIKKDEAKQSEHDPEEDVEYNRIQFFSGTTASQLPVEEYSTLNGALTTNFNSRMHIPSSDDDYSTLNQHCTLAKDSKVKDEYEYTSIRFQQQPLVKKKNCKSFQQGRAYADLEQSTSLHVPNAQKKKKDLNKVKYVTTNHTELHVADSLLNLDTLLIQLREIDYNWNALGISLKFSKESLQVIKDRAKTDFECLVELCDSWIRNERHPTWKTIAMALKEIGENHLSDELLQIYETGTLPDKKLIAQDEYSAVLEQTVTPPPIPPQLF